MLSISLLDTPNSSNLVNLFNFEISFILDLLVSVIHVFTVESNNNVFKLTKSSKAATSANSLCSKFRYSKFIILLAKLTLFILAAPRFSDFNFTRFSNSFTFIGSALNILDLLISLKAKDLLYHDHFLLHFSNQDILI